MPIHAIAIPGWANAPMTYEQALAKISALEPRGWRLGLDRMQEFVRRAGLDDAIGSVAGPQFIHVAGTNGKGSTTAFLQSLLFESGYRTGAFFSPYVVDPRERVQFGRDLIQPQELADLTAELLPIIDTFTEADFGGVTEFELKTAIGLAYWKKKRAEWVALEVGLGGRLDATNVVTPVASVIVSIGLDHMSILGDTLEKIAYEKAGIIKPKVPVIVGAMPAEAETTILRVADELDAPVWLYGRDIYWRAAEGAVQTPNGIYPGLVPSLIGPIQEHNLTLAVSALDAAGIELDPKTVERGAATATIPGRFQELRWEGRTVLFDGAHNPDAAEVLLQTLDTVYPGKSLVLVTNMLAGHEPSEFYKLFAPRVKSVHVVPIDFHRSMPVDRMVTELEPIFGEVHGYPSAVDGFHEAIKSTAPEEAVLITGSFYLVGELLRSLSAI